MITLTKEMTVGIPKIDAQHKELIDRINSVTSMGLESVSPEETQKTLDLLGAYIVKHFHDEEVLQKESEYPKYEWHKEQHELYIAEFEKLNQEFKRNGLSVKFSFSLNNSIINWIVKHIANVDVEFGKYYQSKR